MGREAKRSSARRENSRATTTTDHSYCASSSSSCFRNKMDLSLGLNISSPHYNHHSNFPSSPMDDQTSEYWQRRSGGYEEGNDYNNPALFVKVYMEGIPIGRKMNLLAHDGYHSLIRALDYMFNATILWADVEIIHSERFHALTYEDKEGDWLIVGDVPWEMFLPSVKRLKITRADRF